MVGGCLARHIVTHSLSPTAHDTPLGRADGKVYEALWMEAQRDPLNEGAVTPAYARFIEPIVKRDGEPVLPPSAARQRAVPQAKL